MKVFDAIEHLQTEYKSDSIIAMMIVREDEIRSLLASNATDEEVDRLAELISRTPYDADLDGHYWHEHRAVFKNLLLAGIEYVNQEKEDERIDACNQRLSEELGLSRLIISVSQEIRPMAVVNRSEQPFTITMYGTDVTGTLDPGATWADFLQEMDRMLVKADFHDHVFYEGHVVKSNGIVDVFFGS